MCNLQSDVSEEVLHLAEVLWNYHRLGMPLHHSDCMIILGSHDLRVPDYAADLYHAGLSQLAVPTGGNAHTEDLLATGWNMSEGDRFAQRLRERGVSAEAILVENRATNTRENFLFSRALLHASGHAVSSILLVCKPYMERRALATCKIVWPEVNVSVTSPPIALLDYPTEDISVATTINIMVGDTHRIVEYANRGFQVPQPMPEDVVRVFKRLVSLGFDKHLLPDGVFR